MNLEDLKKRATASELTLIEAVESTLRGDVVNEVRKETIKFVDRNMPPTREDYRMDGNVGVRWLAMLEKHLIPEKV